MFVSILPRIIKKKKIEPNKIRYRLNELWCTDTLGYYKLFLIKEFKYKGKIKS